MDNKYSLIYEVISGSRSYGFANEDSDYDYRGIAVPSLDCILGLNNFEMEESKDPDRVIYSLKKFVNLALNANPNILELLFIDDEKLIKKESYHATLLKEIRNEFLTKQVFRTYLGYSKAQFHKIKNEGNCSPEMNSRRMESIRENGYDLKAATHLIRLLMQVKDIVNYKTIMIPLKQEDLVVCRDIRKGKYEFKDVVEMSNYLIEDVRKLEVNNDLPDKPDFNMINEVVIKIHRSYL